LSILKNNVKHLYTILLINIYPATVVLCANIYSVPHERYR